MSGYRQTWQIAYALFPRGGRYIATCWECPRELPPRKSWLGALDLILHHRIAHHTRKAAA